MTEETKENAEASPIALGLQEAGQASIDVLLHITVKLSRYSELLKTTAAEVVLNELRNEHADGGKQREAKRIVAQLGSSLYGGGSALTFTEERARAYLDEDGRILSKSTHYRFLFRIQPRNKEI